MFARGVIIGYDDHLEFDIDWKTYMAQNKGIPDHFTPAVAPLMVDYDPEIFSTKLCVLTRFFRWKGFWRI